MMSPGLTLDAWMNGKRMTNEALAEALRARGFPTHVITITRWRTGANIPQRRYIVAIGEISEGAVTPGSWYLPVPPRSPGRPPVLAEAVAS